MVEINPSGPTPTNPTNPVGPSGPAPNNPLPPNRAFDAGGGWDAYKEWLGPAGYKKMQAMLCQSISRQIARDKEKEQETKEIMRKSIEGDIDIYN